MEQPSFEHVWQLLKAKIFELYPMSALYGESQVDWTDLGRIFVQREVLGY